MIRKSALRWFIQAPLPVSCSPAHPLVPPALNTWSTGPSQIGRGHPGSMFSHMEHTEGGVVLATVLSQACSNPKGRVPASRGFTCFPPVHSRWSVKGLPQLSRTWASISVLPFIGGWPWASSISKPLFLGWPRSMEISTSQSFVKDRNWMYPEFIAVHGTLGKIWWFMNSLIFYFVLFQPGERISMIGLLCCFPWYTLSSVTKKKEEEERIKKKKNYQPLCA